MLLVETLVDVLQGGFGIGRQLSLYGRAHRQSVDGLPEKAERTSQGYGSMEFCIAKALGQPEHINAYNTYQVKDYNRFELAGFSEEAKRKYREEHWEADLQKAFEAGQRMAETIIKA